MTHELPRPNPRAESIWTGPNLLSLSRLVWAAILFVCISTAAWLAGLIIFIVAAISDWLDGYWARKANLVSALGRNLDPLIDKVLTCGAFIFLIPVAEAGLAPWMVTVVVAREILITGLRGIVEAKGAKFGADRLGKIKMVLQCAALIAILAGLYLREVAPSAIPTWNWLQAGLIYAMLAATVLSGLEYLVRAGRLTETEHGRS